MARYTDESKERVRDVVDFAALVGERVELRRAGVNRMVGLCPFHDERSPSFGIDPVKKVFHCFGCGEGGDVFKWAELIEGLDFTAALESLADRFGVQLERESEDPAEAEKRARRERLLEALERTATFYVRYLWESDEARAAREYLLRRGLEEGVLREFRVGYSPSRWDTVLMASQRAGFKPRELYDAGLVQRSGGDGRIFDRFRSRIMFPLADPRGRVLGFGARTMATEPDARGPKYLNTAENELFHKGRMVYAADLARAAAAKAGAVVMCEGYTDVIALHQAGLRNTVATMGTALTPEQVRELAKLAPVVHMALDADAAGQKAMLRAAEVAKGSSVELRVVPLPAGLDPADLVARDGADAMRVLVERSVRFEEFRVEAALASGDVTTSEGKDKVLAELRPVFGALGPSVLREELLRKVADRLDVTPELVTSLLPRAGRAAAPAVAGGGVAAVEPAADPIKRRAGNERLFLVRCLALPERGRAALAEIDPDDFATELNRRAAAWLRDHLDDPLAGLPAEDELTGLIAKLQQRSISDQSREAVLEADLRRLQIEWLERRMASGAGSKADLAREKAKRQAQLHEVAPEAL